MKQIIISTFFTMATVVSIAQSGNSTATTEFEKIMLSNIKQLDTATGSTLMVLANNFERICNVEKTKWEPYYYAAFCYAIISGKADKNSIDMLADKAEKYLDIAIQMNDNSETTVLAAMILANRVLVDPMSRYPVNAEELMSLIEKAKRQSPSNPRTYYMQAKILVKVPEAMGGGKDVATTSLETAIVKFKDFAPANNLAPVWGYRSSIAMLDALKK